MCECVWQVGVAVYGFESHKFQTSLVKSQVNLALCSRPRVAHFGPVANANELGLPL